MATTDHRTPTRARPSATCTVSPYKVRQVLDLVRGLPVDDAERMLQLCEKDAADDVLKLLDSAIANAEHNHAAPGRRAVRRGRVGRRRPDPQVGPAARPRPLLPDPQAHVARHDRSSPASTPTSSRSAAGATRSTRSGRRGRAAPPRRARAPFARSASSRARPRPRSRSRRGPIDEPTTRPRVEEHRGGDVEVDDAVDETSSRSRRSRPTTTPTTKPRRGASNGSKSQPVRVPARHHHRLEVALDRRQEGIPRVPHRGLEDPRLPAQAARARGGQPRRDRAHAATACASTCTPRVRAS